MGWRNIEVTPPNVNKMYLVYCPHLITPYAVASYEPDTGLWVDNNHWPYSGKYYTELPEPPYEEPQEPPF